jgi:hypothetical protein
MTTLLHGGSFFKICTTYTPHKSVVEEGVIGLPKEILNPFLVQRYIVIFNTDGVLTDTIFLYYKMSDYAF